MENCLAGRKIIRESNYINVSISGYLRSIFVTGLHSDAYTFSAGFKVNVLAVDRGVESIAGPGGKRVSWARV